MGSVKCWKVPWPRDQFRGGSLCQSPLQNLLSIRRVDSIAFFFKGYSSKLLARDFLLTASSDPSIGWFPRWFLIFGKFNRLIQLLNLLPGGGFTGE